MKHEVHVIFGEQEVAAYASNGPTENTQVTTFTFKTRGECVAFLNGLGAGHGWNDYHALNEKEYEALKHKQLLERRRAVLVERARKLKAKKK